MSFCFKTGVRFEASLEFLGGFLCCGGQLFEVLCIWNAVTLDTHRVEFWNFHRKRQHDKLTKGLIATMNGTAEWSKTFFQYFQS